MHNSICPIKKIASYHTEEILFKNSIDLRYERRYYVSDDDDESNKYANHTYLCPMEKDKYIKFQ